MTAFTPLTIAEHDDAVTFVGQLRERAAALLHDGSFGGQPWTCDLLSRAADIIERFNVCPTCRGTMRVETFCNDRQCGDSTWDHDCGMGSKPCPTCSVVDREVLQ